MFELVLVFLAIAWIAVVSAILVRIEKKLDDFSVVKVELAVKDKPKTKKRGRPKGSKNKK